MIADILPFHIGYRLIYSYIYGIIFEKNTIEKQEHHMSPPQPVRKRFYKPGHFLNKAGKQPSHYLEAVFENFHLDDFREELNLWLRVALSNGKDAYAEGAAREDLMDFVNHLHRLVEAWCIIHMSTYRETVPLETRRLLDMANRPFYLTAAEQDNPNRIIRQFCKTFRHSYVKIELLDMLEAVVTYEGEELICKGILVAFYQHLHCLVRLAYRRIR